MSLLCMWKRDNGVDQKFILWGLDLHLCDGLTSQQPQSLMPRLGVGVLHRLEHLIEKVNMETTWNTPMWKCIVGIERSPAIWSLNGRRLLWLLAAWSREDKMWFAFEQVVVLHLLVQGPSPKPEVDSYLLLYASQRRCTSQHKMCHVKRGALKKLCLCAT